MTTKLRVTTASIVVCAVGALTIGSGSLVSAAANSGANTKVVESQCSPRSTVGARWEHHVYSVALGLSLIHI